MTRSRDTGGPNGDEPEAEELPGGDRLGEELKDAASLNALPLDALLDNDDGPPLLPLLDAEAGPARPLAERQLLLLADRIERQFAQQRRRPVSRLTPRRLLLAGGLFAASAAAAVMGVNVVRRLDPPPPVTSAAVPSPPAEAPLAPPLPAEPAPAPPPLPAAPSETEERPAEPGASQEAVPKSSDPSVASSKPAARAPRMGAAARASDERPGGTVAADRLAAANSLRSRHRYREALALYLQVIEIAPNGMQASVARVAAAEMLLEHLGDVAGAERLYREARTQGGELTAEAQFGLAQVARSRADAPGERRALQDFLSRHPESPLVAAARRRLNALGPR